MWNFSKENPSTQSMDINSTSKKCQSIYQSEGSFNRILLKMLADIENHIDSVILIVADSLNKLDKNIQNMESIFSEKCI